MAFQSMAFSVVSDTGVSDGGNSVMIVPHGARGWASLKYTASGGNRPHWARRRAPWRDRMRSPGQGDHAGDLPKAVVIVRG